MVSSDLSRQFPDGHNIRATPRYFRLIESQFVRITNTCRGSNDAGDAGAEGGPKQTAEASTEAVMCP
jgi:hypothetical protein